MDVKIRVQYLNILWISKSLLSDFIFGRCCGAYTKKGSLCGGYVGGKPALKHYREGWDFTIFSIF